MVDSKSWLAFVCSHTYDDTGGVLTYRVNVEERNMERVEETPLDSPSFLVVDPETNCLYTASGWSDGTVSAFRFNEETGELTKMNDRPSGGSGPCYLSIDDSGEYLLVANYHGGTVTMVPIEESGELGEAAHVVTHEGSSIDPDRQQEPHPHSIVPGPKNRFAYAPDLGTDRIVIYRLDLANGRLRPAEPPYTEVRDGAGPRHVDFHPSGRLAYVITELDSTLIAFDYDPETGALNELETVTTLPEDFNETNYCADVHVHPSGRWVYGSNRGHDSIAIFETTEAQDELHSRGIEPTHGGWPRDFALTPGGDCLFAENQNSDSIVLFDVDENSGQLARWSTSLDIPEPMCMEIIDPS